MDDVHLTRRIGIGLMLWAIGLLVVIGLTDSGWYILLAAIVFTIGLSLWL